MSTLGQTVKPPVMENKYRNKNKCMDTSNDKLGRVYDLDMDIKSKPPEKN